MKDSQRKAMFANTPIRTRRICGNCNENHLKIKTIKPQSTNAKGKFVMGKYSYSWKNQNKKVCHRTDCECGCNE